jgi:hypothetical protein
LSDGLISYGSSIVEGYCLVSDYVARIMKGVNPAEMPVRFELVINFKRLRLGDQAWR